MSGDPVGEEPSMVTVAVMLGKMEVHLARILGVLEEHGRHFDEVWTRLRQVEGEQARCLQWRENQNIERARRPSWTTIVSVIVALISLAVTVGLIGEKGL